MHAENQISKLANTKGNEMVVINPNPHGVDDRITP